LSDLFRKEVIDKQSSKHLGDVFVATPLSFWAITLLIATVIAGLIAVAIFGEYARKERVVGVLTPSAGLVEIVPTRSGNFEDIHVAIGDQVLEGDPLFQLRNDVGLSGGERLSEALLAQMQTEKSNLSAQLSRIPEDFTLQKRRLEKQHEEKTAEAERYIDRIVTQRRTVELEENLFGKMQSLAIDEAASALEVAQAENRFLSATQNLQSLENSRANILSEITDIEAQIALLPTAQIQQELEVQNRISAIEQRIIENDAGSESVMRAPIAGTVAAVTARRGQQTFSDRSALTILPKGAALEAELFVPTRAIGFVKPGQRVRLLYDAFPYQKFGFHNGEIIEVSKSVVQGGDLQSAPQMNEAVFLVRVSLEEQSVTASGEDIPLQSGMSLSADLILEDRKIWEWAFDPLLGAVR